MKKGLILLLCLTLAFTVTACGETVEPEPATSKPEQQAEPPVETKVFQIGEPVAIGDVIITINEVREHISDNPFIKPSEGCIFYVLNITIENTRSEPYNSSTMLQMSLADSEGYTYDMAFVDGLKGSLDGEIGPGRKLRGEIAYEIPADATGLEFIYDYDVFGHGQAIFKLDR